MKILVYSPGPPSRSHYLLAILCDALRTQGHSVGDRFYGAYQDWEPADVVITVGWNHHLLQIHDDHINTGRESISISDGFLIRGWEDGHYFGVTRNGLHAYGDRVKNSPDDRLRILESKGLHVSPWREPNKDGHILVCHQDVPDFRGRDRQPWFNEAITKLSETCTDRKLVLRLHPRARDTESVKRWKGMVEFSDQPFQEDLDNCHAVVTFDSNAAVESILRGIPAFTYGKTMADPVANFDLDDIEDPKMPDRRQWLSDMAYSQWTKEELHALLPWKFLIEKEEGIQYYLGAPISMEVDEEPENEYSEAELLSMTKPKLIECAATFYGIDVPTSITKRQIVDRILNLQPTE